MDIKTQYPDVQINFLEGREFYIDKSLFKNNDGILFFTKQKTHFVSIRQTWKCNDCSFIQEIYADKYAAPMVLVDTGAFHMYAYEDYLRQNNASNNILSECRAYIIKLLNQSTNQKSHLIITDSIKKLLPLT